ncbi:response regulator [Candidatus Venteria ishoeyi]|uniref:hybrid sensor histidine kinase/response regulator n=1 Tax=Candidatus Venteria ishoeyi TaxID=1899563 RepID=UPI0025A4EC60|nr:response regulator [Candidatus Venteria ishoeyi]MDM8545281.1 response regulator [Candidatus Venteria ishoeyi]
MMFNRRFLFLLLSGLLLLALLSLADGWLFYRQQQSELEQRIFTVQQQIQQDLQTFSSANASSQKRLQQLGEISGLQRLEIHQAQTLLAHWQATGKRSDMRIWQYPLLSKQQLGSKPSLNLLIGADLSLLKIQSRQRILQVFIGGSILLLLLFVLFSWLLHRHFQRPLSYIIHYIRNYQPEDQQNSLSLQTLLHSTSQEWSTLVEAIAETHQHLKGAYNKIRKSEERFELALQATEEGVYDWNIETNIVIFSPHWKALCGYADTEIDNHANEWFERIHPDDLHQVMSDVKSHLDKNTPFYNNIHRLKHKEGHYIWVRARGIASWDENGDPYRMVGTSQDITAQKAAEEKLRESEHFNRTLIDGSPIGLMLSDMDGNILEVNSAYAQIVGLPIAEIRKLSTWDLTPISYQEIERSQMRLLESSRHYGPFEKEYLHRDGHLVPVRVSGLLIEKQGTTFIWSSVEDITEQKRSEETLIRAKQLAESANLAKSQFIANMSHELRTPLNAIIGYSEMLREDAEDMEEKGFEEDLVKIHSAARHLLGLINDVLDLSKIEAGKMEIYNEVFSLEEMQGEIVATISPMLEDNGNVMELITDEDLGNMYADLTKVRQMLLNLLSNAAKFTENGTITLEITREIQTTNKEDREWIQFIVRDTGIGMTDAQLNNLFQAFTQADASTTRKYGGTGLGLVITKRFTEMMHGHIDVSSEYGQGTCFTIKLPSQHLTEADQVRLQKRMMLNEATFASLDTDSTVLVIDDNASIRELLKSYIERLGYHVVTASGGDEGLQLARESKPALITLDVMMPGMDGWMVLSALKTDPQLANTPVIMISMIEDKALGYSLGAADYLIKPVNQEQLRTVLARYRKPNSNEHLVMIVEDDAITRGMMEVMLNRAGWQVCSAENGKKALQVLAARDAQHIPHPDLILLDLMMPEMDGFEFVEEANKNHTWANIPIIVLTAKDITLEDRSRLQRQVHTIFQKGTYKRDDLLAEVQQQLRLISAQDSNT